MFVLKWINENIVWGAPMLVLFAICGVLFTVKLKGIQLRFFPSMLRNMRCGGKQDKQSGDNTVSPFRTLTAALGTTLGTGNIIAVGTAIAFGGAGAVLWMWAAALIGMATAYSEVVLGMKYRTRKNGGCGGVPFAYINQAFGGKWGKYAAAFFAFCCLMASFGMGNMAQINSAASVIGDSMGVPLWISGIVCTVMVLYLIRGGITRLGGVTAWLIPLASLGYVAGCLAVIIMNIDSLSECISRIFADAFSLKSASGGAVGTAMLAAMQWGVKRGVFSNEAGLGSSVMIHASSDSNDCRMQGMWAMLQVFLDTIVMCTLTAFAILASGADKISSDGFDMAYLAFSGTLGDMAGIFLSVSVFVFAVSTASGWWIYGKSCFEYLFGGRLSVIYSAVFVAAVFVGAVIKADIVWELSDLFNGLMALPNLAAVIRLRKEVE